MKAETRQELNLCCSSLNQVFAALLLCAALQILLVPLRSAVDGSAAGRLPQGPLRLPSKRAPDLLIRHRWTTDGPAVPRSPALSDCFCSDPASCRCPSSSLRPQTPSHRQSWETCEALDLFPLFPPAAAVEPPVRAQCCRIKALLIGVLVSRLFVAGPQCQKEEQQKCQTMTTSLQLKRSSS